MQGIAHGVDPLLLSELQGMTLQALKKRARGMECDREAVDNVDDTGDPKQAAIELIFGKKADRALADAWQARCVGEAREALKNAEVASVGRNVTENALAEPVQMEGVEVRAEEDRRQEVVDKGRFKAESQVVYLNCDRCHGRRQLNMFGKLVDCRKCKGAGTLGQQFEDREASSAEDKRREAVDNGRLHAERQVPYQDCDQCNGRKQLNLFGKRVDCRKCKGAGTLGHHVEAKKRENEDIKKADDSADAAVSNRKICDLMEQAFHVGATEQEVDHALEQPDVRQVLIALIRVKKAQATMLGNDPKLCSDLGGVTLNPLKTSVCEVGVSDQTIQDADNEDDP